MRVVAHVNTAGKDDNTKTTNNKIIKPCSRLSTAHGPFREPRPTGSSSIMHTKNPRDLDHDLDIQ